MIIENQVIEDTLGSKEAESEPKNVHKEATQPVMKAILIKRGAYILSNSFVLPSLDVCLLGEEGTILAPQPNVLAIIGMGNKDIKCSRCGYVLALKVKRLQLQNLVIRCPACGYSNQL